MTLRTDYYVCVPLKNPKNWKSVKYCQVLSWYSLVVFTGEGKQGWEIWPQGPSCLSFTKERQGLYNFSLWRNWGHWTRTQPLLIALSFSSVCTKLAFTVYTECMPVTATLTRYTDAALVSLSHWNLVILVMMVIYKQKADSGHIYPLHTLYYRHHYRICCNLVILVEITARNQVA